LVSDLVDASFPELFEQAGVALLEFAERAESNVVQGHFFEAMGQLRRRRGDIQQIFLQELNAGFQHFGTGTPGGRGLGTDSVGPGGVELSLVNPDDMEERVAAENLISQANANFFPQLFALSERLSVLAGGRKLKDYEIPAAPHHLVSSFRRALEGLDVEIKVKVVLYALFDRYVLRQCRRIYDEYNDILKSAGILPNLRSVPMRSDAAHGYAALKSPPAPDGGGRDDHASAPAAYIPGESPGLGDELFEAILALMANRRPATHGVPGIAAGSGPPGQDRAMPSLDLAAAAKGKLVSALSQAQALSAAKSKERVGLTAWLGAGAPVGSGPADLGRQPEPGAVGPGGASGDYPNVNIDTAFLDRVRAALSQERHQVLEQVGRENLSPVDADLIDLIGMLFEYMLNDPVLPNLAKALLSHLHTPYLKVALIDRRLLVDSRHPARHLLDEMVEAGSLWVEENAPTRGIFPAMQRIVDRVLQEFADDVGLFADLVQEFRRAVQEQQRRTDTVEQRTQEAARGREKLQVSKQHASRRIQALIGRHPLPNALTSFLTTTWLDQLVFILLREPAGEDSNAWRGAVATAEQLVALFDPGIGSAERRARIEGIPRLRSAVLREVERMGSYSRSSVEGLRALLDDPNAWKAEALSPAPGDGARAGRGASLATGLPPGLPQADSGPEVALSGPHKETIERLRKLRFGTWFELASTEGGIPRRVKLSWMSPLTSTCMFVDRSGMQAEIKSLAELADEILSGRAKVIPRPKHPFIDRALVSIRKMLQGDGAAAAAPAGGWPR
jgi:hypothetical protein